MAKDTAETDELVLDDTPAPEPDIEIELEPAEEPKTEGKKAETKVVEPQEGLETLRKQLEDEKAARAADQQARLVAEQRAARSQNEVQDSNVQLVTGAIAQMKQATDVLKGRYAEAMQQGDFNAAADVQAEMAEVAARKMTLENGLEQLKNAPKAAPPVQNDPVEQLAQQLSPRSAAWVRAHPQYARDQNLLQGMIAAHNVATNIQRLPPDSDEYFASVERTLGLTQEAPRENPMSDAADAAQRRQSPPAAPVSRGSNGGPSGNQNVVRLSAEEREMAHMMRPDPKMTDAEAERAYAINKRELMKEGKILN